MMNLTPDFPRISVAIPHYNQAATLAQSLESVCSQDPPPSDVLLLDDCSTDNSLAILEEFASKYPFFRFIRYPQKSADWVTAFWDHRHLLIGDYILWFACDDLIHPGFFRAVTDAVRRYPQAGVVFSDYHHATVDLRIFAKRMHGFSDVTFLQGEMLYRHLCRPYLVEGGIASVVKREAFLWLAEHKFYELGPWTDSMGYPVAAMKHGAIYLPGTYGLVRVDPNAYSTATGRDEARSLELFHRVHRFFHQPAFSGIVPPVVAAVLERKCLGNLPASVQQRYRSYPQFDTARQLLGQRDFSGAYALLQQVAQSCPALPEVFELLGVAAFSLNLHVEAERLFRQALLFQPQSASLHSNLGATLQAQGDPAAAIWSYWQALQLQPTLVDAHSNLGTACAQLGRLAEAIQAYRTTLQLQPNNAGAQAQLKQLLAATPGGQG